MTLFFSCWSPTLTVFLRCLIMFNCVKKFTAKSINSDAQSVKFGWIRCSFPLFSNCNSWGYHFLWYLASTTASPFLQHTLLIRIVAGSFGLLGVQNLRIAFGIPAPTIFCIIFTTPTSSMPMVFSFVFLSPKMASSKNKRSRHKIWWQHAVISISSQSTKSRNHWAISCWSRVSLTQSFKARGFKTQSMSDHLLRGKIHGYD